VPLNQFLLGYRFELLWLWLWVVGFVWIKNLTYIKSANSDNSNFESKIIPLIKADDVSLCNDLNFYKLQLVKGIYLGFGLCLILTLGQLMIGKEFVQFFGYTDSSLELQVGKINSPICHVIDYGVDSCRLASPFSSPNHLAGYLIFVLGFIVLYVVKRGELESIRKSILLTNLKKLSIVDFIHILISAFTDYYFIPIATIITILIFLTYSRFALIVLVLYWFFVLIYLFKQYFSKSLTIFVLFFTLAFSLFVTSIDPTWTSKILPTFLAKPSSSQEHYRLTGVAIDILKTEPQILLTGLGQGSSGSSTTYFRPDQNVIYNKFKDISYKWFIKPERISVPENWYLQLILNGGLMYFLLYLFILIYPLIALIKKSKSNYGMLPLDKGLAAQADWGYKRNTLQGCELKSKPYQNLFVFLSFFGIVLGNIFLHLWENQTIVIYWSLVYIWWSLEIRNTQT
jgi:hypothetical protein